MTGTNTYVYRVPAFVIKNPSIFNKALNECKKHCEEMGFHTTAEFLRSETTPTFKSYNFEELITIYNIWKKAENAAQSEISGKRRNNK